MAEVAAQRAVAAGVPAGGGEEADLAAAAMRGRGEVDTSSPFRSVRQAVDLFGGGAAAVSQWRHLPVQLRPEVSPPALAPHAARRVPPRAFPLPVLVYAKRRSGLWLYKAQPLVAAACSVAIVLLYFFFPPISAAFCFQSAFTFPDQFHLRLAAALRI